MPERIQLSRKKWFSLAKLSFETNGLPAVKVDRTSMNTVKRLRVNNPRNSRSSSNVRLSDLDWSRWFTDGHAVAARHAKGTRRHQRSYPSPMASRWKAPKA